MVGINPVIVQHLSHAKGRGSANTVDDWATGVGKELKRRPQSSKKYCEKGRNVCHYLEFGGREATCKAYKKSVELSKSGSVDKHLRCDDCVKEYPDFRP